MEAPGSIGQFVNDLEKSGELKRISEPVDPFLEVTALSEPVMKNTGPALLFENPKGSKFPLAINLFGSPERMCRALGVGELDQIAQRLRGLLAMELPSGGLFAKVMGALPKLKELSAFAPRQVKSPACQEVVLTGDDADLNALPVLTCWPGDGGPFITLPQVITADPESGRQNSGMYRMQVYDQRTTGMHWHRHKGGAAHFRKAKGDAKLPVAVALGGPPAAVFAATAPLPPILDEFMFTGFLMGRPLKVARCVTNDLLVPAEAEFVLEGYVDPAEPWRTEGPFGDHTGFYSLADEYPVFHLTAITMRKNPIYPTTIVGIPPMEDFYLGMATERLFLPLLQMVLPEVVDYHMPAEGVFHNLVFVSIKKQYPGHAFKVMNALWGQGQMMFAKVIVVLDHDVEVQNPQMAWWEALNHIDPVRDILFSKGPADALDHAAQQPWFHSKMGIDATKKTPEEGFTRPWPDRILMTPEVQKKANQRLKDWGLL